MNIRNFGLAPVIMNEAGGDAGGGGGAVAVADAPATSLVPSGGSGGNDSTDIATMGDGAITDLATTDTADAGRRANPALAVLKGHADPEVQKFAHSANQAIAVRQELRKRFPGQSPFKALDGLMGEVTSLAGRYYNTPDPNDPERRTGFQQIRDKMAEFEEIDFMFYGGDPRILDGMTSDDEGKAAFAKLAPSMNAKWREIAPNAWAASAAKLILADAKDAVLLDKDGKSTNVKADVPLRIERAYQLLGENASAADIAMARQQIVAVYNWLNRLEGLSALAPEVFATAAKDSESKLTEREKRLAEREFEQRIREYGNARQIMADQAISKVFTQLTKGRTISAEDQEDVQSLFVRRFDNAVKQREPGAEDKRKRYLETEDREGYLAHEKYLIDTYGIPALKTEVGKLMARIGGKPAAAATTTTAPGTTAPGTRPVPTPQGYFKLAEKPPSHIINTVGRTKEMVFAKQATLRVPWQGRPAGSKVCW